MSWDPFGVAIVPDEDFTARGYTDDEDFNRETARKIDAGEWSAYGVVVYRMCDAGDWHATHHSVWGTVVDTTTDAGGVITDPQNIGDEHLRSLALDLLTEARTARQDGALCAVRVDRDDWTGPCGEPIDLDGMCDDHARMRDEGAL